MRIYMYLKWLIKYILHFFFLPNCMSSNDNKVLKTDPGKSQFSVILLFWNVKTPLYCRWGHARSNSGAPSTSRTPPLCSRALTSSASKPVTGVCVCVCLLICMFVCMYVLCKVEFIQKSFVKSLNQVQMNNTKSLQMGRPAGAREAAHRRPCRHLQRRALLARHQRRGKARPHEVVQHIAVEVYRRLECALFSTSSVQVPFERTSSLALQYCTRISEIWWHWTVLVHHTVFLCAEGDLHLTNACASSRIGPALADSVAAFAEGDFDRVCQRLHPIRYSTHHLVLELSYYSMLNCE